MRRFTVFSYAVVLVVASSTAFADDAPHEAVLKAEADRVAIIERATSATLAVMAPGGQGGGSGVIISSDGYALTNYHVSQPAGDAMKCGMPDGKLYDAVIVGIDPTGDVALIKVFGRDDFPHATLGDSDALRVGDWCFVSGNPFVLANDFTPSVSYGIISGVHRYQYPAGTLLEYADCIQTDAAINPGNSGGPLWNSRGELVGINGRGSFEKRGRVNVGVGYAISINQIKHFMGYLRSGRVVDHATLGATVTTDEDGAVVVDEVLESSDAYRRGLRYDDEIVEFGGRDIHTVNAFKNVLGIFPRGWRVPLVYRREGELFRTTVRLAGVHREGELRELLKSRKPAPKPDKPDKKPKEGEGDKEEKPRLPKLPDLPIPGLKKTKMPKIVADHFEKRDGYVNYYFNRTNRERVWNAFQASAGDFASAKPRWTFTGSLSGGGDFQLAVSPELGVLTLPVGESKARFTSDLTMSFDPPGSGGLLAALHVWQRLLREGPERFGEVYYLGSRPIPPELRHLDVLAAIFGGVETQFYFDPQDGRLVAMELWIDSEQDPAELYFSQYEESEGRWLPRRIQARAGDATFAAFDVHQVKFDEDE